MKKLNYQQICDDAANTIISMNGVYNGQIKSVAIIEFLYDNYDYDDFKNDEATSAIFKSSFLLDDFYRSLLTPSEQCKSAGIKSLNQLSEITSVSRQTLINWHRDKPQLFTVVVSGAAVIKGK